MCALATIGDMRRHLSRLWAELDQREPVLVEKIRLLEEQIRTLETAANSPYGHVRSPLEAVECCLHRIKMWMTKDQITWELLAGGWPAPQKTARLLIGDTVKYNGRPGRRLARDTSEGGDWVGLPEWVSDSSVQRLSAGNTP